MMGILSSLQAAATPLLRISTAQSEYSTSTAAIGCTFAARRIVSAPTSERPIPPITPAVTSCASAPTVCSISTFGSFRAHSKISIFFTPSSTFAHRTAFAITVAGLPSMLGKPALMESTTRSASSGYLVKYARRRWRELYSGVPYSSPPFQKVAPASSAAFRTWIASSVGGGTSRQVRPLYGVSPAIRN